MLATQMTDIWTDDNDLTTWRIGDGVTIAVLSPFGNGGGGALTVLSDLSNVSNAVPTAGQVLKWSGTQWAPVADANKWRRWYCINSTHVHKWPQVAVVLFHIMMFQVCFHILHLI